MLAQQPRWPLLAPAKEDAGERTRQVHCAVLIDLCNAMQENFAELKMSILELQLVLKRGDDAAVQLKFESFIRAVRKAQKPVIKTSSKANAETF
ncbi:hypothetical protein ABZP36_008431 [Zizania latifolia]